MVRLIGMSRQLTVLDFNDFIGGDEDRKQHFIQGCGTALQDIGFFALKNHGISISLIEECYQQADDFFCFSEVVEQSLFNSLFFKIISIWMPVS